MTISNNWTLHVTKIKELKLLTQRGNLTDILFEKIVDTQADTLAETEAETHGDTLGDVKTVALGKKLPQTLA